MGDLSVAFLLAGGALLLFGPLGLVILAVDARECRCSKSPRQYAKAALWSGMAIYAGFATVAFFVAKNGPPGVPPWEFVRIGLSRMPYWGLAAMAVNGLSVLWAWWILRDEERHPDRAMVDAALTEEREEEARRRLASEAGCRP